MITKYAGMLTALLGVHLFVAAQTEIKKITALRSGNVFKIDGNLNELEWKTAPVADKFIELRPNTFRKEDEADRKSVV